MGTFKYNLYEPLELSGSFKMGGSGKIVGGKLTVDPGRLLRFDLQLFNEQHDLLESTIGTNDYLRLPYIYATLEENTFCTIQNSAVRWSGLFAGGISAQGLTKHIIFNQYFNTSATFDGVAVLYNLWPEFCHPQGFKQSAERSIDPTTVATTKTQKLVFSDTATFSTIQENSFFDATCFFPKCETLVTDVKAAFEKAKQEAGIERFIVGLKSNHLWFVRFEQKTGIDALDDLEREVLHFANLLMVLTYYPSSPIACDLFASDKTENKTEHESEYPWLFLGSHSEKLLKRAEQFTHQFAPITFPKIKGFWETVVVNWFSKKEDILPYVGILRNNMEGGALQFKFPRCADALKQIAQDNRDKHYQLAIERYAFPDLQNYLFKIFEVTSCKKAGEHISRARAYLVHGNEEKRESWEKVKTVAHSVECLELIILSYLQQIIGVPDQLREDFQNHWLNKLKDMNWIKF